MTTIHNWKDVKVLLYIADNILEKFDKKELLCIGEPGYYGKVLVEYERYKNTAINKRNNYD